MYEHVTLNFIASTQNKTQFYKRMIENETVTDGIDLSVILLTRVMYNINYRFLSMFNILKQL